MTIYRVTDTFGNERIANQRELRIIASYFNYKKIKHPYNLNNLVNEMAGMHFVEHDEIYKKYYISDIVTITNYFKQAGLDITPIRSTTPD